MIALHMFPPYSEKILRKRVAKVAWCPTSDLAAIVFDDSSIALCRDGVSPIWSLPAPNDSNVLTLAWNPQGMSRPALDYHPLLSLLI